MSALSQSTLSLMEQYAGMGTSQRAEDNLVPLVYILQQQSPQCIRQNEKYIEGAEAGMIWLRQSAQELASGEEGIVVQPCVFGVVWIEWVPRKKGGGFVARHRELPEDAVRKEDDENPNKIRWVRPNGNELIETREFVVRVQMENGNWEPYVIPMSSSGHTIGRGWMTSMNRKILPSGKIAPAFGATYRLRTKYRRNELGEWYTWDVEDLGPIAGDDDLIQSGYELHAAFAAGDKQAGYAEEDPPFDGAVDGNAPV